MMEKINYKGYSITQSKGSGKTTNGNKRTATIRVIQALSNGFFIKKQYSFPVNGFAKKEKAIEKCKLFIDSINP